MSGCNMDLVRCSPRSAVISPLNKISEIFVSQTTGGRSVNICFRIKFIKL